MRGTAIECKEEQEGQVEKIKVQRKGKTDRAEATKRHESAGRSR